MRFRLVTWQGMQTESHQQQNEVWPTMVARILCHRQRILMHLCLSFSQTVTLMSFQARVNYTCTPKISRILTGLQCSRILNLTNPQTINLIKLFMTDWMKMNNKWILIQHCLVTQTLVRVNPRVRGGAWGDLLKLTGSQTDWRTA